MDAAATGASPPERRPGVALLASSIAFTLVILGTTVVNVALPSIHRDLGGTVAGLQWVINAYTLMLASLLLTTGSLCDQRGARRVMLGGLSLFLVGATVAAAAPTLAILVAGQALLGTGAAALLPASLSLISNAYPDDRTRARAISVFASSSAVAIGLGPVVGGLLINVSGWRAIFVVDVPLTLIVAATMLRGVAETPRQHTGGLDLGGQLIAIVALSSLTFALIQSGTTGWGSPEMLGTLALAAVCGVLFVAVEHRGRDPMLPLSMLRSRLFSASAASGLLVNFGVYGQFFVLSLYLQEVRGLSALQTGLIFLVQPCAAAFAAIPGGVVTARHGPRLPVAVGGLFGVLGTLLLLPLSAHSGYATTVMALVLVGVCGGLTIPALTTAVVSSAPRPQVGIAAAAFTASRQIGGILGVAILGAVAGQGVDAEGRHLAVALAAAALGVVGLAGGLALTRGPRLPGLGVGRADAPTAANR